MEEKERYEVKRLDYSLNVKLVDNNEPDWRYIIFDSVNDEELAKLETVCDWLNQKDRRIKELEEINKLLKEDLVYEKNFWRENNKTNFVLHKKLKKENQQLKQQLHDLPKKIVEEITNELSNNTSLYFEIRESTSAHCPNKEYEWFNYVRFRNYINTILKKFGGEDVKD